MAFSIVVWAGPFLAIPIVHAAQLQSATSGGSDTAPKNDGREVSWKADVSVHSTAEDVLAALQKLRPRNEPIAPAGRTVRSEIAKRARLWPEGMRLVSRLGLLVPAGQWWTFQFEGADNVPPLKLLPNATLETMVRTDPIGGKRRYVLSGELTVFDGENYVLAHYATRPMSAHVSDQPESKPGDKADEAGTDRADTPLPTRHDDRAAHDADVAVDASAEDVLAVLAAQKPDPAVISSTRADGESGELRSPGGGQPAIMDGTPIVRRPGRVLLDGKWWTFLVESQHSDFPEPPLRLLPNLNTELMVQAVRTNNAGLVFIVSGEVFAYGGDNYLLARAVLRRPELGNLRK